MLSEAVEEAFVFGNVRFRNTIEKLAHARLLARFQLFHGAERDYVSLVYQDHAVGDEEGAGELVGDDDNGHSEGFFQFQNQIVDACGDDGIEARGRLVKKENFGIHSQGASDCGALFHAAAQLRGNVIFVTGEAHFFQLQSHHDLDSGVVEPSMLAKWKSDIFSDGHRAKERTALKRNTELLAKFCHVVSLDTAQIFTANPNLTARRFFEAHQRAKNCVFNEAAATENN